MASENKKRKGKNSFIDGDGLKNSIEKWKCRRLAFFTKTDRMNSKKTLRNEDI